MNLKPGDTVRVKGDVRQRRLRVVSVAGDGRVACFWWSSAGAHRLEVEAEKLELILDATLDAQPGSTPRKP